MRALLNWWGNLFVPRLLNSPLHFLASGFLILITFTGRKSGKQYTTPVQYKRLDDHRLLAFTQRERTWWKNLRGGTTVTLRYRGQNVPADAHAVTAAEDEPLIRARLATMFPRMSDTQRENLVSQVVMIEMQLSQ